MTIAKYFFFSCCKLASTCSSHSHHYTNLSSREHKEYNNQNPRMAGLLTQSHNVLQTFKDL